MLSDGAIAKIGMIILGSNNRDEIIKEASKQVVAKKGISRAVKLLGLGTGAGAVTAGAHQAGKSSGRKDGAAKQLRKDQNMFRSAAPGIYRAGRISQARKDHAAFSNFLKNNTSGMSSNKKHSKMSSGSNYVKTANEITNGVVDGWISGHIKTAEVKNLSEGDLQKVAACLSERMSGGDNLAKIMWNSIVR